MILGDGLSLGELRQKKSGLQTDLGIEQAWAANRERNMEAVGRRCKRRPCPIFSNGGGRVEKKDSAVELNVGFSCVECTRNEVLVCFHLYCI
jgi:hypothetical protein